MGDSSPLRDAQRALEVSARAQVTADLVGHEPMIEELVAAPQAGIAGSEIVFGEVGAGHGGRVA